jgi:WD40 repeat protein
MTVLMPGIRTVFIHNITSPKFRAPVFSKSNRAARWVAHIGYYDSDTAKIIQNIVCQRNNIPEALAFSPDGLEIAVGGCLLYKVSVYSVATGKPNFQTDVDPGSWLDNAISYNPKGTLIAVGSSRADFGKVTILNASGGSVLETLPDGPSDRLIQLGEHAEITNLQWISNNLILTSYDASSPDGGIARIWDTTSLKIIGELQGNDLQLVSISPDGSRLAAVFGKKVVIGILH